MVIKKLSYIISIIGAAIAFIGFMYGVIFVNIPYQDPTPEMVWRQNFHSSISDYIMAAGLLILMAGIICLCIYFIMWIYKKNKN